ncbi:hypothetical protein BX666DRAFT_1865743, partial [Dichotomocladium elegans]
KNKAAGNLINLLLPEIETFPAEILGELALRMAQQVQDQQPLQPRMFEVFSKMWNVLTTLEHPVYDILERVINAKWKDHTAIGLASAFNEMELKPSDFDKVIRRLTAQIKELGIDETPPYIYQMEGTVMLHVSFAIKQDQELGTELLKYLKSEKSVLSEIFDLLRNNIISICKDSHKLRKCAWIAAYSDVNADVIERVIKIIAEQSAQGWDQVIQPLIQLSMHLIDMASSQGLPARAETIPKVNKQKQGPMEKVMSLGKSILIRMFELHDFVRLEILDQITSRIVTRSTSIPPFLELLETLIEQCPYAVEPYLANVCRMYMHQNGYPIC